MNGAHLHLVLTHLPVVGILGAIGILAVGVWRRLELLQRTGLVLLVLTGLAAGAAYVTGEGAEEAVEGRPGLVKAAIERHEEAAQLGLIATGAVGLVGATVLVLSRRGSVKRGAAIATLVGALLASGLLTWTANLGGQIGHPEITTSVAGGSAGSTPGDGDE